MRAFNGFKAIFRGKILATIRRLVTASRQFFWRDNTKGIVFVACTVNKLDMIEEVKVKVKNDTVCVSRSLKWAYQEIFTLSPY